MSKIYTILTFLIIILSAGQSFSQQIWVRSDADGKDYNLSGGDVLRACDRVSGEFRLEGATVDSWLANGSNPSSLTRPSYLFSSEGEHTITAIYTEGGVEKSITAKVEVISTPTSADFELSAYEGCIGTTVTFNSKDTYQYSSLRFLINSLGAEIPDGGSYTFTKAGSYEVVMEGVTKEGCIVDIKKVETIEIIEDFDFSITPEFAQSCSDNLSQRYQITSASTTGITYTWDFGDGSALQNGDDVTHNFNDAGGDNYTVTVTGEKNGCTVTKNAYVTLNVAQNLFEVIPPSTFCDTYEIQLRSTLPSELNGQNITWTITEDGVPTTITRQLPSTINRTFTSGGKTVTIEADYEGCTQTEDVIIPDLLPTTIAIDAKTEYCELNYDVNLSIINESDLPAGYSLSWKVGTYTQDASNSVLSFSDRNPHTIELVASGNGIECTLDQITVQSQELYATINSSNGWEGCEGLNSTFTSRVTHFGNVLSDAELQNVKWSVIKVGGAPEEYFTTDLNYTFNDHGTYTIQYEVENLDGCNPTPEVTEATVLIGTIITPTFDIDQNPICNDDENPATFTNTTDLVALGIDPNQIQFQWNYGGGWVNSYDGSNIYTNYAPGGYDVMLRAIYNGCESNITTQQITIEPPRAEFTFDLEDECDINTLAIINASDGDPAFMTFDWEVNVDGNIYTFQTTDKNKFYLSDKIGVNLTSGLNYSVALTATLATCEDIFTDDITPEAKPTVDITSKDLVCKDETITFSPGAGINDGNATFEWTFKKDGVDYVFPGSPITNAYPSITFTETGEYEATVKVTFNDGGCEFTESKGGINVIDLSVTDITGVESICLNDTGIPSSQTFSVTANVSGDLTKIPNFRWRWEVYGDGGTPLLFETGKDPSAITESIVYDFVSPRNNQNNRYRIYFSAVLDSTDTDVCGYTKEIRVRVTAPTIDFVSESDNMTYFFACDKVVATLDPKLDRSKLQNPQSRTYNLVYIDDMGVETPITDFTEDKSESHNVKFIINDLPSGTGQVKLSVEDANNCSVSDILDVDVPSLPFAEADFTPSATNLVKVGDDYAMPCRGSISFTDNADNSVGNSTPRTDVDGNEIAISKWFWTITSDVDADVTLESDNGELDYYFEAGNYEITLMTEDTQGCTITSTTQKITVGGVRGKFTISKKIGYAPFNSTLEGTPSYVSVNSGNISYRWFSGDGRSELIGNTITFLYDSTLSVDRNATPGVIFEDEQGCSYPANSQGDIVILRDPVRTITDILRCTTQGDYVLNVSDPTFTPADVDNTSYSYKAEVFYQWYVDGVAVNASNGGTSDEVTFTFGKDGNPFTVDPDLEDGRTYIIKSWIEADYVDKIDASNSHSETVAVRADTFNVVFEPQVIAKLDDFDAICVSEELVLDGSLSDFGDYTRGNITSYFWEVSNWGDTLTTEPVINIKLDNADTYTVKLTVTSDNSCSSSTIEKDVLVNPLPVVEFTTSDICLGETNTFTNQSTYNGSSVTDDPSIVQKVKWYFDYGDPTKETVLEEVSPEYTFDAVGIHKVKLEVYSLSGCLDSVIHEVEIYALPEIVITEEQLICFGESIELTASGGVKYLWSNGETTDKITVAPTADSVFTVQVTNANNCVEFDSVRVNVIPSFDETTTFFEACDGESLTLDALIVDYPDTSEDILWSTDETTSSIVVTESGTYTVSNTVTHTSGKSCTFTKDIEVIFRDNPGILEADTIFCFDNGPLTLTAPSGSNFTYLWDNSETTQAIQVTTPGIYTVTIVDNTHPTLCETKSSIEVITPVTVADFTADAVCLGETTIFDGSASTTDREDVPTEYVWNLGTYGVITTTEPTLSYDFPDHGTHTVELIVQPIGGCPSDVFSSDIIVHNIVDTKFTVANICQFDFAEFTNQSTYYGNLISGDATGIQSVQWDFDYDGVTPNFTSTETSPSHQYDVVGTYDIYLEITTENGCTTSFQSSITVHELPSVTISEDIYICEGETTELIAGGGVAYEWITTSETTSNIQVSPTEDTMYKVKVTNEHGCIAFDSMMVYVIPSFNERTTFFEACDGETITLNAELIGYPDTNEDISWSTGETTTSIVVTESNTYTVSNTVTHSSGKVCTFTKDIEVIFRENPGMLSADTVFCFDKGPLTLTAPSGSNFTYLWDNNRTSQSIQVTEAGTYTVTIVDNSHPTLCETTSSIEVITPVTVANFTATPVCLGDSTVFDASGSTSDHVGLPTEYIWDLGTYGTEITTEPTLTYQFPDYGTHTIQLTVQPIGGCPSEVFSSDIVIYNLVEPQFTVENICRYDFAEFNNQSTYYSNLISGNDTDIQSVKWDFNYDGSTPNFTNTEMSPSHQYTEAGTFEILLEVTTTNGCATTFQSSITVHDLPEITISEDIYICEGAGTTLTVSGGVAYEWLNTSETSTDINVSPTENTMYKVRVINEHGCLAFDSVMVFVIPQIEDEKTEIQICMGEEYTLDGSIGDYEGTIESFVWSTGETTPSIDVTTTGEYIVTNSVEHSSGKLCTFTRAYNVYVRDNPSDFADPDTTFCFRTGGEIEITAPAGNNFVYLWEDTGETSQVVKRDEEGLYEVKIIDTSYETACEMIASIDVVDLCPPQVFTPTAMTPNGDGLNDEFLIRSRYSLNIKLNIYNRWGEIIFSREYKNSSEARTEGNGWDGTYRGKLVPGGVYTYTIDYVSELDGSIHRDANSLTVIR
ncbi:PKD domain-containing protein [Flammeovirga aprica JL-4]|uniref:PKD domain-containing protein n=2 Tax=Flammeovirga aprica TaxID=29528 RepID=A0A7X9P1U1_9BACT|nr:PKD domain-containing protein [Flammeovirga aprica JL-4]